VTSKLHPGLTKIDILRTSWDSHSKSIYVKGDMPLHHNENTTLIIINAIYLGVFVLTQVRDIMRN
jgi:hypothetical protein